MNCTDRFAISYAVFCLKNKTARFWDAPSSAYTCVDGSSIPIFRVGPGLETAVVGAVVAAVVAPAAVADGLGAAAGAQAAASATADPATMNSRRVSYGRRPGRSESSMVCPPSFVFAPIGANPRSASLRHASYRGLVNVALAGKHLLAEATDCALVSPSE